MKALQVCLRPLIECEFTATEVYRMIQAAQHNPHPDAEIALSPTSEQGLLENMRVIIERQLELNLDAEAVEGWELEGTVRDLYGVEELYLLQRAISVPEPSEVLQSIQQDVENAIARLESIHMEE